MAGMTTLPDRPNTALLVIDVQNGVVGEAHNRDDVVANIATLVDQARAAGVDVVWVQHTATTCRGAASSWQYVPELVRDESEPLVHKTYADSFEETDLEAVLAERGIGRVFVVGRADRRVHPLDAARRDRARLRRDAGRRRPHDRGPDAPTAPRRPTR